MWRRCASSWATTYSITTLGACIKPQLTLMTPSLLHDPAVSRAPRRPAIAPENAQEAPLGHIVGTDASKRTRNGPKTSEILKPENLPLH